MSEEKQNSPFVPLLLLAIAVLVWFGFQTIQLVQERSALATLNGSQEATYRNAQKMRGQLDALAAGTQKLANAGNRNAQSVVGALQQRGITINPDAPKAP